MKKNINQILDKENNVKNYFLYWLFIVSFILRLLSTYFIRDHHFDHEWNVLLDNLIQYKSYSYYSFNDQLIPSAVLPPLYPFFIYSVKLISSANKANLLNIIIFIQIFLSTYSVYLFYEINKNFFSEKISFTNSIFYSIFPLNIIACGQISSISLQIFLSLLFIKFLFLLTKSENKKNIFVFSIVSGFLILTRGEFFIIFLLMVLFSFFLKKIKLINLIKIFLITILIISPYVIRNQIHFNEIFIVKSLGYNLWKGNNQLSKVEGYENLEHKKFIELKNKINNLEKNKYYELARDSIFFNEAIDNLKENPNRYINLSIKKFFSYYFIDLDSTYKDYFNFFHFLPVIILSLLSIPGLFLFFRKKKFENRCLGVYLLLNLIIFSIFFVLPRYKLIILPVQLILVSYFIIYLIKKLKKI